MLFKIHKIFLKLGFLLLLFQSCTGYAEDSTPLAGDVFVKLPRFIIPVIQERKLKTLYSLDFIIKVKKPEHSLTLILLKPIIIDKIFSDLFGLFAVIWTPNIHIQLDDIKKRLFKICSEISGNNVIDAILIQSFNQQIIQ